MANNWITGPLNVDVYYHGDPDMPPLITGISGPMRSGEIDSLEQALDAYVEEGDIFSEGPGDYHLRCKYNQAETDGYGRVELPAHWEIDRLAFKPLADLQHGESKT